jgi:hypothetical protein
MEVLTNREIYYNNDGKDKTGWLKKQQAKLKELEKNALFQTGAAAYGGYLTQRYQGGGFQPLSTQEELGKTSNQPPTVLVTEQNSKKGMSLTAKIGIGVGVAAVIGIVIFVVVRNRKKAKK